MDPTLTPEQPSREPQPLPSAAPKRRWPRRLLLGLLLLLLALPPLLYFALKSNRINQTILSFASPLLKTVEIEQLQVGYLSIDLLHGVELRDLSLHRGSEVAASQRLALQLRAFTLAYDARALLDHRVEIQQLLMDGVDLNLRQPRGETTTKEKDEKASQPLSLNEINALLDTPPLPISVNDLRFNDIALNLSLGDEEERIAIQQKLSLQADLLWSDQQLSGEVNFAVTPLADEGESALLFHQSRPHPLTLALNPGVNNHLRWSLKTGPGAWQLQLEPARQEITMDRLTFERSGEEEKSRLSLDHYRLEVNSSIHSDGSNPGASYGLHSLFPLQIALRLDSSGEADGEHTAATSIRSGLSHRFQLSFAQLLAAPKLLLHPLQFESDLHLQLQQTALKQPQLSAAIAAVTLDLATEISRQKQEEALTIHSELLVKSSEGALQQEIPPATATGDHDAVAATQKMELKLTPQLHFEIQQRVTNPELLLTAEAISLSTILPLTSSHLLLTSESEGITFKLSQEGEAPLSLSLDRQRWQLEGDYQDHRFMLRESLQLEQLTLPHQLQPLNFRQQFSLHGALPQPEATQLQFSVTGDLSSDRLHWQPSAATTPHVAVTPKFQFNAEGRLDYPLQLQPLPKGLDLTFDQKLSLEQLQLASEKEEGGIATLISSRGVQVSSQGALHRDQWQLESQINAEELMLPQLLRPLNLSQEITIASNLQLTSADLKTATALDELTLLTLSLAIDNTPRHLQLEPHLTAHLRHALHRYHSATAPLQQLGEVDLTLKGTLLFEHPAPSILEAELQQWSRWPIRTANELTIKQITPPRDQRLRLVAPLQLTAELQQRPDEPQHYHSALSLSTAGVQYPPLLAPLPFQLKLNQRLNWPPDESHASGALTVADHPLLRYQLELDDRPEQFSSSGAWQIETFPSLQNYLTELKPLSLIGTTALTLNHSQQLRHTQPSLLDLLPLLAANPLPNKIEHQLDLQGELAQSPQERGTLLLLERPLSFNQSLQLTADKLETSTRLSLPALTLN
ncbi:MAG: hypothetical protein HQL48_03635, partial [Gammaproteobacteria bacterium]|nr:hypothetical protein [Gammaproteobacteria bacterium]